MLATCVPWPLTLLLPAWPGPRSPPKTFAVLPFTINGPDKYQYLAGAFRTCSSRA
jgi:hypothetical protein